MIYNDYTTKDRICLPHRCDLPFFRSFSRSDRIRRYLSAAFQRCDIPRLDGGDIAAERFFRPVPPAEGGRLFYDRIVKPPTATQGHLRPAACLRIRHFCYNVKILCIDDALAPTFWAEEREHFELRLPEDLQSCFGAACRAQDPLLLRSSCHIPSVLSFSIRDNGSYRFCSGSTCRMVRPIPTPYETIGATPSDAPRQK